MIYITTDCHHNEEEGHYEEEISNIISNLNKHSDHSCSLFEPSQTRHQFNENHDNAKGIQYFHGVLKIWRNIILVKSKISYKEEKGASYNKKHCICFMSFVMKMRSQFTSDI